MSTGQATSFKLIERPIYGSSRVGIDNTQLELFGYTAPTSGITTYQLGLKQYEFSNHLGNVLTTVTDKKIPHTTNGTDIDYYLADITSATDYYPFGSPMDGRTFSSDKYRFGFNGKEKDNELKGEGNSLDFGARIYDSRLGRWLSRDHLAAKYPSWSPYCWALDNPIRFVDYEGKGPADPPLYVSATKGTGNVIIIIAQEGYDFTQQKSVNGWDVVVVKKASDAVKFVNDNYINNNKQINNLVFSSHSMGNKADKLSVQVTDKPDTEPGVSEQDAKNYPKINDSKILEQMFAIGQIEASLSNNANILVTACEIGQSKVVQEAMKKLKKNYTIAVNQDESLDGVHDTNGNEKLDEGEGDFFRFDAPQSDRSKPSSKGYLILQKGANNNIISISLDKLAGGKVSLQINSNGSVTTVGEKSITVVGKK